MGLGTADLSQDYPRASHSDHVKALIMYIEFLETAETSVFACVFGLTLPPKASHSFFHLPLGLTGCRRRNAWSAWSIALKIASDGITIQCDDLSFPYSVKLYSINFEFHDKMMLMVSGLLVPCTWRWSRLRAEPLDPCRAIRREPQASEMSDKDSGTPRVFLVRHGKFPQPHIKHSRQRWHWQITKARRNGQRMGAIQALPTSSWPKMGSIRSWAQARC